MKIEELIIKKLIQDRIKVPEKLLSLKREISMKYKTSLASNIELLKAYHKLVKNKIIKKNLEIEKLLKIRPVRSLSGIVNISVLTKPFFCPGKCIFCPLENGIPKSYLSGEPAVERAKKLNFNPYLQVKKRIEMLELEGHSTQKIELRIIGGTWSFYPKRYQEWFVKRCFQACNRFEKNKKVKMKNLEGEQEENEKAKHRIVGLSIETRPDFINEKEIKNLRKLGVTMVELGVQSIDDEVLKLNLRGHTKKETILATRLLKDSGFKILYQMMPNLLGSHFKKDEKMFKELFENPDFFPDYLKIYPCALLKEAPLYKLYLKGEYRPYLLKTLIKLLKKIKIKIPYFVRIQRIMRDIPSQKIIEGGAKVLNLRQLIKKEMEKEGLKCKCIRCREVREDYNPKDKIYLFRQDYDASQGKEIFLSFETKKREKIYSLLRLRVPSFIFDSKKHFIEVLNDSAIIREVQTFGEALQIGSKKIAPQHRGLGKRLIKKAEEIARKEFNLKKIASISGVGARDYWRKLGYRLKETYMIKTLD